MKKKIRPSRNAVAPDGLGGRVVSSYAVEGDGAPLKQFKMYKLFFIIITKTKL